MMRKKNILAYISCINTYAFDQFEFGCYEYISFDLFTLVLLNIIS
jgi:hypothetical protein